MANTISVNVVADVAKMRSSLSSVQKDLGGLSSASSKAAGFLGKSFKIMGAGVLALGAGVVSGLKFAYDEALEARKVTAQTNAVIKSTGGVANVTAKDIDTLTTALSNKTAIDDEVIAQGANVLLTFTKVRNEVGAGNDVFNQAVGLANDMSVALGTDMKGATLQLGKALNDPIKGVTSLGRAGVQFTEQQKEQIKTLVESGNILGAQKIILKELETQFAGSAEAAATPMDRLKVVIGNLAETVGLKLMPYIDRFATYLAQHLPGALVKVEAGVKVLMPPLIEFGTFLRDTVLPAVLSAGKFILENAKTITILVAAFYAAVTVLALVNAAVAAYHTIMKVAQVTMIVFRNAQLALNLAMMANPIGLVIAAIVALVAIFVIAWKNSETFRNIVIGAWNAIKSATSSVWNFIKDLLANIWSWAKTAITTYFNFYKTFITTIWNTIKTVTTTVWNAIKSFLTTLWNTVKSLITTLFNAYKTIITTAWNAIKQTTTAVWNAIKSFLSNTFNSVKTNVTNVWNAIKNFLSNTWDAIRNFVTNGANWVRDRVTSAFEAVRNIATTVWNRVRSIVSSTWSAVKNSVQDGVDKVLDFLRDMKDRIVSIFTGAKDMLVNAGKAIVQGLWSGISSLGGWIKEKVMDFVKDVLPGPVEKVLGISSPSRVFRKIGKYTVQGLAKGLDENRRLAMRASQRLAETVQSGFDPRLSVSGLTGKAGAYTRGSAGTVQVTVVAPVGSSPADIGRELQSFLDDYYRSGGRRLA